MTAGTIAERMSRTRAMQDHCADLRRLADERDEIEHWAHHHGVFSCLSILLKNGHDIPEWFIEEYEEAVRDAEGSYEPEEE